MISKNDWQHKLLLSDLPLHLKAMGCIIAEYADWNTGEHMHPGLDRLERECHVKSKTSERNIAQLVKSGWLAKTYDARSGPARKYANEYRLTIPSDQQTWMSVDTPEKPDHQTSVSRSSDMNVPTPIHAPTLNYHSNNHSSIKGDQTSMSDDMRSSQNQEEKSLCLPGFNERSEFDLTLMPPGVDDLDRILNPMPPGKKTLFYQASAEHGGGTRLAGKSRARPGERKEWKDEIEKIDREDYGYDSTYPTG